MLPFRICAERGMHKGSAPLLWGEPPFLRRWGEPTRPGLPSGETEKGDRKIGSTLSGLVLKREQETFLIMSV